MPLKLSDKVRLMTSYVQRRTSQIPGPSSLFIETTSRCNLRCPMCPRTGSNAPNVDMPDETLFTLLKDFAEMGGDHVYLYGLGEPLLDKRIFKIIRLCRRMDIGTVVSTNGTLLTARARKKLLASGCEHLIVGIDGIKAETYEYYREGGVFADVVEKVRAFAEEKKALSSKMTLVVQLVRMGRNMDEISDFLKFWQKVPGVDLVRIKDEDIGLPDHAIYAQDGFMRKNPCHMLWRGPMVIKYTGDVFPCYHMASHADPIGNLHQESLESIWNSERMQELRLIHAENRFKDSSSCAACPSPRPKLPFILGALALRGVTVRKLLPLAERMALTMPGIFRESRTPAEK